MNDAPEAFWTALPLGRGVKLIRRDSNGLAAFAKPEGILSHPNKAPDQSRSLLDAPYAMEEESYAWAGNRLWLVNRLDAATSGVILAAASEDLAKTARGVFKERRAHKAYRALVFGRPKAAADLWRDKLSVQKSGGRIRTGEGTIPAETAMKVVRAGPVMALLSLEPHTGRSHQLRVQCAKRGLPIVGDQTYGDFRRNREFARATGTKRLFLHSLETSFDYEFRGKLSHFAAESPLPPEFEQFL